MPFVQNQIMCTTCSGNGTVKPVCAFRAHEKVMCIECPHCRGVGHFIKKMYLNESKPNETKITGIDESIKISTEEGLYLNPDDIIKSLKKEKKIKKIEV